ncbi:MAG: NAD-dependent epimerase/dehydratase family protein [Anaerolineae bacterium]
MQVLVTGGAGYIGSHLVDALRQAGHAVRALDLRPANGDFIQGSVADPSLVARAVRDVEVVYHLAWGFYPGNERREVQENLFSWRQAIPKLTGRFSTWQARTPTATPKWPATLSKQRSRRVGLSQSRIPRRG